MPAPSTTATSDALAQVLTNLASDRRARIRYYGNVDGLPGNDRVPRRLLSDYSFLQAAQFNYVVPSAANVVVAQQQRFCTLVALYPYGLELDRARLVSTLAADRRVTGTPSPDARGVRAYPGDATLYVPAYVDDSTLTVAKTATLVRRITSAANGASYHFAIARNGDILVGAALDDECLASGPLAPSSIDVALEGALAVRATDWEARAFASLYEVPYTGAQLITLAILFAKLGAAYPAIHRNYVARAQASSVGYAYVFPTLAGGDPYAFTNGGWKGQGSPFDYGDADFVGVFANADAYGPFDLATQVFRPLAAPVPEASRAVARLAVSHVDSAGARAIFLGAYADCAAPERSYDMQQLARREVFINRVQRAHLEADQAGAASGTVSTAGTVLAPHTEATVTSTGPHSYDFATGLWGDGSSY